MILNLNTRQPALSSLMIILNLALLDGKILKDSNQNSATLLKPKVNKVTLVLSAEEKSVLFIMKAFPD